MLAEKEQWIQTYTGRRFYPLEPLSMDINIYDIAHALSLICRYNGHCLWHYSVAQHSILVSRAVPPHFALWGLLHDAAEAYFADIARPVKHAVGVKVIEQNLTRAVADKFGLCWPEPAEVQAIDRRIILDEKQTLMCSPQDWHYPDRLLEPLGIAIERWSPERAEGEFLSRYFHLRGTI